MAAGETAEVVAEELSLTSAQIQAALQYAAHLTCHVPPAVREVS